MTVADGDAPRTTYDKLAADLREHAATRAVFGAIPIADVRRAARLLEYIPRLLCALAIPAEYWRAYFGNNEVQSATDELFHQWLKEYEQELDEAITVSDELTKPSQGEPDHD